MAPYAQRGSPEGSSPSTSLVAQVISTATPTPTTSRSYNTKGSTPTSPPSTTTVPTTMVTATRTYVTKGSPTSTTSSMRGSLAPSTATIQGTTLAFILILTLLLGVALGIFAFKKGWARRSSSSEAKPQEAKPTMLQRQDSNATLVEESSLGRHRRERSTRVQASELRFEGDGSVRHVESVVAVPQQARVGAK